MSTETDKESGRTPAALSEFDYILDLLLGNNSVVQRPALLFSQTEERGSTNLLVESKEEEFRNHEQSEINMMGILRDHGNEDNMAAAIGGHEAPKRKRRKRGKGRARQIGTRRKKTSTVSSLALPPQDESPEDGKEPTKPNSRVEYMRKWRRTPSGRESVKRSNKKYKASKRGAIATERARRQYQKTPKCAEAHKRAMQKYRKTESYAEAHKRAMQKYRKTESYAEAHKRAMKKYMKTESYAEAHKRAMKKYMKTESYAQAHKRAVKKYRKTELYAQAQKRATANYMARKRAQKSEKRPSEHVS